MFPLAMPSCWAEGIPDEELDSDDLGSLLQSLRCFKAKYNHMTHQEGFFYDALRFALSRGVVRVEIYDSHLTDSY